METKKITIAMVSVIVAVLLISGIVVPIIADATKGKETTGWVEHTGDVPYPLGPNYDVYIPNYGYLKELSYMIDPDHSICNFSYTEGDTMTSIDIDRNVIFNMYGSVFPIWADNNIIVLYDLFEDKLSIVDLTPDKIFSDQPIITEFDNEVDVFSAFTFIRQYGSDTYTYQIDYGSYLDVTVSEGPTYCYYPVTQTTTDYREFVSDPDLIPPINPYPTVSFSAMNYETAQEDNFYIGLTSGTYQAKETVTEEAPISVRMLVIVPLLMAVGIVVGAVGVFVRER